VSKQTPTTDVFDRLAAEHDDPAEPEAISTAPEAEDDDDAPPADAAADREPDDDQPDEAADRRPPGRWRRRVIAVLVGAVVVAALGLSGYLGWRVKQLDDTAAAGRAALEAARNYAVILTTLDAKDIDKNYQQALDGATGEFKNDYSQGSAQLRQILIDNSAAGKGMVIDSGIKSATKTNVEVLLFLDQSVTNAVNPSPRIDRNRVQMTMELVDHRWLASKVEII
jgi:Mce-associated membrane protein